MLLRRNICATLLATLLAVSPAVHALSVDQQHDVYPQLVGLDGSTLNDHHDHGSHDHSINSEAASNVSAGGVDPEPTGEDVQDACCHGSGASCAYVAPATKLALFGHVTAVFIAKQEIVPHLSRLIPAPPPPRALG